MNRHITTWLALVSSALAAGAADLPVRFGETRVSPNVVKRGGKVAVSIPFKPDAGWRYLAYRIIAYRPCVPTACFKSSPWPLSENKHGRKWDSFGIRKWTWLHPRAPQPTALDISLDTTGWPPGDYRLQAVLLFRDASQSSAAKAARDRYLGRAIHLSLLPAKP